MSDFVKTSHVFLNHPATTIEEALRFLSEQAVALGLAEDQAAVLDAFHAREEEGSTGMVNGFSIPHAKTDAIHTAGVCVVKFATPIADWVTYDESQVVCAIALLVPDSQASTTHIQLLSKVAVMLMDEDFRTFMLASDDAEAIAAGINARLDA